MIADVNTSTGKMMHYIQEALFQGREPDENGVYTFTKKELAAGSELSESTINVQKENLVDILSCNFDFKHWAKYDEYAGENLFIDVTYSRGKLSFKRNPLTYEGELKKLWALPPLHAYYAYDVFDEHHRRRHNYPHEQVYDSIPWCWGHDYEIKE